MLSLADITAVPTVRGGSLQDGGIQLLEVAGAQDSLH